MKRVLTTFALLIVTLLVVGVLYEQVSRRAFEVTRPPDREFVEVEGRRVHFVKRGEDGPTVVFQGGLGSDWRMWEEVQNGLADRTTTLAYDRAGILWSDPIEDTKTLESIDAELRGLLEATHCPEPYVLVGHSLAGITLRSFIAAYPDDIAGVVFVDVSPTDLLSGSPEELRPYFAAPPHALVAAGVHTGLLRALFSVRPFVSSLPAEHWFNRHVRDSFSRSYRGVLREAEDDDTMFEQAARITSFGDVPLVVIAAAYPNGVDSLAHDAALTATFLEYHRRSEEGLLGLSTNSRLVVAQRSDHYVPLHEPELIVDAVVSLVNAWRAKHDRIEE